MRTKQIMIRINDDEKTLLNQAAKQNDLAIASWARSVLLREARETVTNISEPRINNETKITEPDNDIAVHENNGQDLNLLSLFCGPGGLDLGFSWAGFNTELAIDINDEYVKTFAKNHQNSVARKGDLSTLSAAELDDMAGHEIQPIGVIGGPPCQSFSVSNVHQTETDQRHDLPGHYAGLLRVLNERHPISFFLFENVPGLLGKKHIDRYNNFKKLFEEAGFEINEATLNAKNYGIPQERERIFIVGINSALHQNVVWEPPPKENISLTVRDFIEDLPEPIHNVKGIDPATIPLHPNHWCMVPRSKKFTNGSLQEGTMWGRSFRVLTWDEPSWTVAYGHREVHVHPYGHRRLSIYEAMLLQSFPDDYVLTGNISSQINMVSEAVPPRLALHIALSIRNCLGI